MLCPKEYSNFTECYHDLIYSVAQEYDYRVSPRKLKIREKLACSFTLLNPRHRLLFIPERKFSVMYMIAELLWYLSGSNQICWISNYASFWKQISDDGQTANSAYGSRIFKPHPSIANTSFTQWEYVKAELSKDPSSRRAVMHIKTAEDSISAHLDVPCTLSLQFFIRHDSLHMITHMRSSDLILGIVYDVPAFTFLQELMAFELGLNLGKYTHVSNSLHIYEKHDHIVDKILTNSYHSTSQKLSTLSMPPLKTTPPIKQLIFYEAELQKLHTVHAIDQLIQEYHQIESDSYWIDWIKILAAHRLGKIGQKEHQKMVLNSTEFIGYSQCATF